MTFSGEANCSSMKERTTTLSMVIWELHPPNPKTAFIVLKEWMHFALFEDRFLSKINI